MPQIIEHPLASDSQDGYLSREDWTAFNSLFSSSTIDPGHKHSKLWASDGSPEAVTVDAAGLVGVRTASPTASLHLPAGVATANGAPLKFTAGTNLTAPENGTMEYDGTNFYLTSGGVRQTIGFAIGMDHGGLAGLGDDDHTQYLLASGSRALSGDWDIGAGRKISAEAIYARSNAGLKLFEDGGTGIFVQDSTGNVGIGTTSPGAKLSIEGDADNNNGMLKIQHASSGTGDNVGLSLWTRASGASVNSRNWQFQTNYNNYGDFNILRSTTATGNPSTNVLTIDKSGNIGIGTTGPTQKLEVAGVTYINSAASDTVYLGGQLWFGAGAYTTLRTDTSRDFHIDIYNGGSYLSALTVKNSGGNVGIGTTSPDSKLHLSSSATTSDVLAQFFASGMTDTNYIDLYLGKSRGTDLTGTISFVPQATAANSYLQFGLYGTAGPLVVSKNNVGIGTVTPQSLLNVKGTGLTVRLDGSNDTGAIYEQFRTSAGSATGYVGVEGNTGGATFAGTLPYATFLASGASGAALQFGTVGVARMLIGSSGNVGVGTTSPIFKHDVNGGVYSRLRRGQLLFNNAVIGTQLALIAETVTNGLFTLGGTGYLAANVTVQANGLQVVTSALDDDSANVLVNNPVLNLSQNPVVSFRFKLDNVTNACSFVGLTTAAFVNKTTLPNDCALIGIDADNVHGFGTNRLILVTRNNGAAAVIDDLGVNMTSGTGVWAVLNTTDPDQPRVWINGTEVSAASILGTIKDATDFYLYAHNQNLAAGAHTMTWVCDQWQNDQPY